MIEAYCTRPGWHVVALGMVQQAKCMASSSCKFRKQS